jgi:Uma2 family endonuclease
LILDEPELHLGDDIIVPDLAGWRRERMPEMPDAAYFTLAPDWTCEVLSPRTAGLDRVEKMEVYARERVVHVWHVDPEQRTLEVFRLDEKDYRQTQRFRGDAPVRAEPFDAIELDLVALWSR